MHSSKMSHFPHHLSQEQEQLARDLSNDYSHFDLLLADIRALIADHPNLSKAQRRKLLDRYSDVIKNNPNLVKQYGSLAVFQEFVALSAYDPAHGGNYAIRKPSVEGQLNKGIQEAIAELGVMETGKIPWPLIPSTENEYEGTDPRGQTWDVKAPRSATPDGKSLNVDKVVDRMNKDFENNENIILDDSNITPKEIQKLYQRLKAKGQESRVVWWPIDPNP